MICARDLIVDNRLTEEEIRDLIDDLTDELSHQKKAKYIQKVDAVRELLKEISEEYPNQLALEENGIVIDRDVDWRDLFDLFENTYHAY